MTLISPLITLVAIAGLRYCPAFLPAAGAACPGPWPLPPAGMAIAFDAAADEAVDDPPAATAPPAVSERAAPGEAQTPEDPVVALLDAIERSDDDLTAFTAMVTFEDVEGFAGAKVIRTGRIIYRADGDGADRSFAILFDRLIRSGRARPRQKDYIFKDCWLVEVDHADKLFIKRQIAREGERFDPFKLGQGPIPLPVGQEKDEVLARFEVSLIELPEEGPLAKLKDAGPVDGLRLVPRPDTPAAEDLRHVDLFYDRATHLPVGVSLVETNGDRKTARLDDIRKNPELTDEERARISIETPDPTEWHIDIRPLE